jgi:formiminotetrahydrofolate cyclodeaminase
MVAALTHEKKGFDDYRDEMESMGIKAQTIKRQLTALIDEDTDAFNAVIKANRLPDSTKEEMTTKEMALLEANKRAINVPLEVVRLSHQVLELAVDLVNRGNPNSVSDVGVAGEVAYAGVRGGSLNVFINLSAVDSDPEFIVEVKKEVELLLQQATSLRDKIFTDSLNTINR